MPEDSGVTSFELKSVLAEADTLFLRYESHPHEGPPQ